MQPPPATVVPGVTAVIVTHDSAAIIDSCIDALAPAFPGVEIRIVVVDSGSADGTADHVRRRQASADGPDVEVIEMSGNRGFGAGINVGAGRAPADDALLALNPDVQMFPGSGLALLEAVGRGDRGTGHTGAGETGVAVPRLVDPDGSLQYSLRRRPTLGRALGTALLGGARSERRAALSEVVADERAYDQPTAADWATGAAMLISPRCRARVGAWDESYFLYSEETDYLLRAGALGFRVELVPKATAVHIGGESTTSPMLWSLLVRNKVAFYRRTHHVVPSALFWLITTAGETARAATGSARSRAAVRELVSLSPRLGDARAARDAAAGWVCFSANDWWYHNHGHSDFQLMTRIARDRSVLFVNSIGMRMPAPGRSPQFMRRLVRKALSTLKGVRRPLPERPRFHVLSPLIVPFYGSATARRVNRALVRAQVRVLCRWLGIRNPVQVVTIPTAWEVVRPMRRRALVFNRSDKHSAFSEVEGPYVENLEHQLLESSDAIVYVSHALMQEDQAVAGPRAHFLDHGVDLDHFRTRPVEEIPHDLATIPGPRIGFFGGIDDYIIDLELLGKVATRFPEASVVLIGDVTCPVDELEAAPNVHLLGQRPYAQIPSYGSGFDVALMPWVQNEWIAVCNPIKVKEYLALGLPVVTTWYAEAARYEHVMLIATSHDQFLDAIASVLAGRRPASPEACRAVVLDASWDACADRLRAIAARSR
jgi:GT2 family glycosyltransferase/glycosyltransferase involved in cell wall biosynthesis